MSSTFLLPVAAFCLISFLSVTLLVLRALWQFHKQGQALLKALPSAPRHWLYGSFKEVQQGLPLTESLMKRATEFPYAHVVWISYLASRVQVVHPDSIKAVLKRSDPKGIIYHKTLEPWLGEGLLIASGKKWFHSRRLLTPAFHFDVLRPYVKIYNNAAEIFMDKLETMEAEKGGHRFALFSNVCSMSLDVILQCAFSFQSDCQMQEKGHPYVRAVFDLANLWTTRAQTILYQLIPFLYWLTPSGRKFLELCDLVHKDATDVINRRINELEKSGGKQLENKKYLDFLDILLTSRDENGNGMPPADMRAEVDTFLFEGHDTTASGTSWALYCLAQHPEYQAKVHKELDDLLADRHSDEIEWDDIGKIPYLSMCLKEAMRVYPPVPLIGRELSSDLELNGHAIPKGTNVVVSILGCHHNPSVWGDDHMEYKPDRFLPENSKDRSPYAFVSFSAGPRNCIGQHFALNEMKVVLCRLLRRYRFEVADNSPPVQTEIRLVLRPKEEIYLRAVPRHISI